MTTSPHRWRIRPLRCARVVAAERQRPIGWYYLSFAGEAAYLGSAIVRAHGILTAIQRATDLGILRSRCDVTCWPIPKNDLQRVPPDLRNRLLTEREVRERLDGKAEY